MLHLKQCALAIGVSATLLFAACVMAAEQKAVTLLFDLSGSNPLLTDKRFTKAAAEYAASELVGLKKGDKVHLQSFGSLQSAANFEAQTFVIKRHGLKSVQRKVGNLILALPQQAKSQSSTNILAWFGRNQPTCTQGSKVIFITDGLEASEYIPNVNDWLNGKVNLPKPNEFVQLKGCRIEFYGLGAGMSDKHFNVLRRQWGNYFKSAGANFKGIAK